MMNTRITNFDWQLRSVGAAKKLSVPAGGKIVDAYPDKDLLKSAIYAKIEAAAEVKYSNAADAKFTLPANAPAIFPIGELGEIMFAGADGAAVDFAVQLLKEGA